MTEMTYDSRRIWKCPGCGSKWQLPTNAVEPRFCPRCEKTGERAPQVMPGMPVVVQSVPKTVTKKSLLSDVSVTMVHVVICFSIIASSFVFGYVMHDGMRDEKSEAALFTAMATTILMAPAFIAGVRQHPFVLPIYVISFFLGWTCVAWIGVAIWAVWPIKRA